MSQFLIISGMCFCEYRGMTAVGTATLCNSVLLRSDQWLESYSTDPTPSDYQFFLLLKETLWSCWFHSNEDIMSHHYNSKKKIFMQYQKAHISLEQMFRKTWTLC